LLVRPAGYPIINNLLDFTPTRFLPICHEYPKKYGSFVEYYIFGTRGLWITDKEVAREILTKRPKKFSRSKNLQYSTKALNLGSGLFHCYGPIWYHIRKATATSFNQSTISAKFPKVLEELFNWTRRLSQENQQKGSVDMKSQAMSLTVRVISIVAFGLDSQNSISTYFFSSQFLQDMESMFKFSLESVLWFLPMFFWRYSSKYQYEINARESGERFTSECTKIIKYKRQLMNDTTASPHNIHGSMIDSMLTKESQHSDSSLTDDEIIANVKTIYLAGTDTTAVVITWMTYYFTIYPELRQRAREEATKVLFTSPVTGNAFKTMEECISAFQMNKIQELTFCMACMKEVLRLSGPAPTGGNQPLDDSEEIVLSNGIIIGKNDVAWINSEGIHMNEVVFESPYTFNPSRWLTKDVKKLQEMEAHFFAFGYGPRVCPGMNLSYHEGVIATAFLAYHFDMELNCPQEEIKRIRTFTACPNQMPLILKKAHEILN
jgi:cytochrome P450